MSYCHEKLINFSKRGLKYCKDYVVNILFLVSVFVAVLLYSASCKYFWRSCAHDCQPTRKTRMNRTRGGHRNKKKSHLWLSLAVLSNFDLMRNNAIKVNDVHHLLFRCLSANSLELVVFRAHKTQYQPTHYGFNIHIDNIRSLCAQEFDGTNAKKTVAPFLVIFGLKYNVLFP